MLRQIQVQIINNLTKELKLQIPLNQQLRANKGILNLIVPNKILNQTLNQGINLIIRIVVIKQEARIPNKVLILIISPKILNLGTKHKLRLIPKELLQLCLGKPHSSHLSTF